MNALPLYRAAASILLLRDSKDGLQVLMLKRPANISFANAWVFPGGCREPQDKTEFLKHCECVLSDAEACRQLGVERFGKSWWYAAVRELFEEAGILLLARTSSTDSFHESRDALLKRHQSFGELVEQNNWQFDFRKIQYLSFWIAPEWISPRYATRFFVAKLPEGQEPIADGLEALEVQWYGASRAIELQEQLLLPRPTIENLRLLLGYRTVAEAMAAIGAKDKSLTPAIWPRKESGEVVLSEVSQDLEGLNIMLVDNNE